ncbi:hypothetical protein FQN60_009099 [Etheostoma spectabile]|uniref:Cystine/glutamate transporter n=1 Tax=Etheostoma spectabile TaxID=54343 RepID=A0A5J5CN82_9PERO|nr:hypothetical protein FQN60_009099 [Etheostoma spectabile]
MTKRSASIENGGKVATSGHKVSQNGTLQDGDDKKVGLGKKVTLLRGISIIIGTIIGAGIFISPKGILKHSGSVGMSLIVWIACGVLSLFGALSYAELGTCIKKSGGHYTYILEAFGPQMAFVRLWADLIAIRPAALAVISLAFGQYILEPLFMPCSVPPLAVKLATAISITSVMYLNSMSVTWTARIQIFLTFSKLLAIGIIIVPGMYQLFKGETKNFENAFDLSKVQLSGMPLAFYSGMYAYAGWFYLNFVIEEVDNPERCDLSQTFAEKLLGKFSIAVPVFVALSCYGSMNGGTFALSRMFYVASREGHLPEVLSMIHVHRNTPMAAVFILYPMTMLQLFVGDIYSLLNFMSFLRWLFIGVVVLGLLYLRYTKPDLPRPFKVPLFIPVVFCLTCFFMVFLSLYSDPVNTGIGFAISLTGIPAYYIFIHFKHRPKWLQKALDSFNRSLQIILLVVPAEK